MDYIALLENGNYKVYDNESDIFRKKDKIEYVLVPTNTYLKGKTYTLLDRKSIDRVYEESITINSTINMDFRNTFISEKFSYNFEIDSLTTAANVYTFHKLFHDISLFTAQHPATITILGYSQIEGYPSRSYPYKIDEENFNNGYHEMILKILFNDGKWYILDQYNEAPSEFTAIFIFNIAAYDGYLLTQEQYDSLYNKKLYIELTTVESIDYPTEGDVILSIDIHDRKSKYYEGDIDSEYCMEITEAMLVVPQIIMFMSQILKESMYLLVSWDGSTSNMLIDENSDMLYSIYHILFNN